MVDSHKREAELERQAVGNYLKVVDELRTEIYGYMCAQREQHGVTAVKTPQGSSVSFKALPPSVIVVNEAELPDEFVKIERKPNKTAIGNALKAGMQVPGASLSNGGETIQIRG
jgi:hypothetical protein